MAAEWWFPFLKLVHVLSVVFFLGNLALAAYWKVTVDRRGNREAIAAVHDRIHRSGRQITAPAALLVFVSGYVPIRILGGFGGRIAAAPFALWGLILFFLALLLWYLGLRPLEARMANQADAAVREGRGLGKDFARASGLWLSLNFVVIGLIVFVAWMMVFKPWG